MPQFSEVRCIQTEVAAQLAEIVEARQELATWTRDWQLAQSRLDNLFSRLRGRLR